MKAHVRNLVSAIKNESHTWKKIYILLFLTTLIIVILPISQYLS